MVTVSLIQCNFEFCKHWLHSCSHDIKRSTSVTVVRRSFTRIAENSLSLFRLRLFYLCSYIHVMRKESLLSWVPLPHFLNTVAFRTADLTLNSSRMETQCTPQRMFSALGLNWILRYGIAICNKVFSICTCAHIIDSLCLATDLSSNRNTLEALYDIQYHTLYSLH